MRPSLLPVLSGFLIFSYQRVDVTGPPTKEETAYATFEPSEYFSNLEYELVVYADATSQDTGYWGSVLITVKMIDKLKIFL